MLIAHGDWERLRQQEEEGLTPDPPLACAFELPWAWAEEGLDSLAPASVQTQATFVLLALGWDSPYASWLTGVVPRRL